MLPRQHARIRLLLGTLLVIAPFARRHTEVTIRSLARRNGTGERLRATRVRWVVLERRRRRGLHARLGSWRDASPPPLLAAAKLGVLAASAAATIIGLVLGAALLRKERSTEL